MMPGITGKHKMEGRWKPGVWLGIRDRSSEVIVGTMEGCIKVRSVRKAPEEQKWGGEQWDNMKGTPWSPVPGRPGSEIKSRAVMPPPWIGSGSPRDYFRKSRLGECTYERGM